MGGILPQKDMNVNKTSDDQRCNFTITQSVSQGQTFAFTGLGPAVVVQPKSTLLESQAIVILMQQTPPIRSNNQIKTDTKKVLQLRSEAGLVFGEKRQLEDTAPSLTSLVLSLSFLLKTSD